MRSIRRALLSVSDKTGLVDLARFLTGQGVELLSTGGTARLLAEHALQAIEVSDYTGFPEIMGGRVKTLHPKIYGGILGRRGIDEPLMQAHGIGPIDLVVVNLYPFESTVARADCTLAEAIENIDIGGPALVRAAAKNHAAVTVMVDPDDYAPLIEEMRTANASISAGTRYRLAAKAFAYTARYDSLIAAYLETRRTKVSRACIARAMPSAKSSVTAKTLTNAPPSMRKPIPRRVASPQPNNCKVKISPSTISPTPTWPWSACFPFPGPPVSSSSTPIRVG